MDPCQATLPALCLSSGLSISVAALKLTNCRGGPQRAAPLEGAERRREAITLPLVSLRKTLVVFPSV